MAFKINKKDQKVIEAELKQLETTRYAVERGIEEFNTALAEQRERLQSTIDAHNEQAEVVRGKIEDIHREMDEEFDNKSEKWRDGDKAATVREWLNSVETFGQGIADISLEGVAEDLDSEELLPEEVPTEKYAELDKEPQQ